MLKFWAIEIDLLNSNIRLSNLKEERYLCLSQALEEKITDQNKVLNNLSPEEQLQFALDQMMKKKMKYS